VVTTQITTEVRSDDLLEEVRRYLVAIAAFRAAGYEPRWQQEPEAYCGWTRVRAVRDPRRVIERR